VASSSAKRSGQAAADLLVSGPTNKRHAEERVRGQCAGSMFCLIDVTNATIGHSRTVDWYSAKMFNALHSVVLCELRLQGMSEAISANTARSLKLFDGMITGKARRPYRNVLEL